MSLYEPPEDFWRTETGIILWQKTTYCIIIIAMIVEILFIFCSTYAAAVRQETRSSAKDLDFEVRA